MTDEILKEYYGDGIGFNDFKQEMGKEMGQKIVDSIKSIHVTKQSFCLDADKFSELNKQRPLKISDTTFDVPKNFSMTELFKAVNYLICVSLSNSSYAKKWYLNPYHSDIDYETKSIKSKIDSWIERYNKRNT